MRTTPLSVRPYLAFDDGNLLVEPLAGVTFSPTAGRREVHDRLRDFIAQGTCVASVEKKEGATLFHVAGPRGSVVLVFDDDSDRLLTIVPLHSPGSRLVH